MVTDEEIEQAKAEIEELFDEVREDLAQDLGGEPQDYPADRGVACGDDE